MRKSGKKGMRIRNLRRRSSSALCILLCLSLLTGCATILGDGPVTIETAPPIVTPKLTISDNYGKGNADRFNIEGPDAFFLLPGIENHPDRLQDFNCLDYTDSGYFIYYYCGAAFISEDQVKAYKGTSGEAPTGTYRDYGGFLLAADDTSDAASIYPCISKATGEEEKKKMKEEGRTPPEEEPEPERESSCDAMIVMAYRPETRKYQVMDAQAYGKETAASETGAATGMDFYESSVGFYTLSHCYGCRIAGKHSYFIFDQDGQATVWNDSFQMVSRERIGDRIMQKVEETESTLNLQEAGMTFGGVGDDSSGGDDGGSDREELKQEISDIKGNDYEEDDTYNCLIKSSVMDATGVIFCSLLLYQGNEPWVSTVLLDRVVQLYSIDLSAGDVHFTSTHTGSFFDSWTAFTSDKASFPAIIGGYGTLHDNYYRGYAGLAMAMAAGTGVNIAAAAYAAYTMEASPWMSKYDEINERLKKNWSDYEHLVAATGISKGELVKLKVAIGGLGVYRWASDGSAFAMSAKKVVESCRNFCYAETDNALWRFFHSPNDTMIKYMRDGYKGQYNPNVSGDYETEPEYRDMVEAWNGLSFESKQKIKAALASCYLLAANLYLRNKMNEKGEVTQANWSSFQQFLYECGMVPLQAEQNKCFPTSSSRTFIGHSELRSIDQALLLIHATSTDFSTLESLPRCTAIEIPEGQLAWVSVAQYNEKDLPTAYRLNFPRGSIARFTDMDNTPGSTTASVTAGALLFSDEAEDTDDGLEFTSSIRWEQESGVALSDDKVPGAAIDSGALEYLKPQINSQTREYDKIETWITPMLITDKGVKLYAQYARDGTKIGDPVFLANEDFLTTTGFTPYTESAMQASVSRRLGEGEEETYADAEGMHKATEEKIAKSLNSSRVGTIQSASSFTVVSPAEVLISAYDSGLTVLRMTTGNPSLHLKTGSYYQTFPVKGKESCFRLIGYDTEEYEYGSMDLARAKVYDLDLGLRKNQIYRKAMQDHLDRLAADYVRRQNRTRTEFTTDESGVITGETVKVVSFEDDHGEEAEIERNLFGADDNAAFEELKKQEKAIGVDHQTELTQYLMRLRNKVTNQQDALREVLALTGATKLGDKLNTDPYWVSMKERMQATTELGDLKDLLAEAAMSEDVVNTMTDADEKERYKEMQEVLDYKREDEEKNAALGEEDINAEEFEALLEKRKTVKDYEEQYDLALRSKDIEENPLHEYLNTDNLTSRTEERENAENGRATVREEVLEGIKDTWYAGHKLPERPVYAPDGSYEMMVTKERIDEAWDNYLTNLLSRINPDNLTAQREEMTDEKQQELRATASTAAKEMAQLVEFMCEDAGEEVTQDQKIGMVEDLLIAMEMVRGAQMAEEMVLIERTELSKFKGYRTAYDAFNQTDFDKSEVKSDSSQTGGYTEMELSAGTSLRLAKYQESDFYKKVIVPMQESASVKAYLAYTGYSWEQYMASLPTIVQSETHDNEKWDPAQEAKLVYETFEPFKPQAEEEKVTVSDGTEERPSLDELSREETGDTSWSAEVKRTE